MRANHSRTRDRYSFRTALLRNNRGNIIVLVIGIIATVALALAFFSLRLPRMLGGFNEQRTAAEAAALAAARDLSSVVINDPYWGYVGLSDYAPVGTGTTAGDGYAMPVNGINTILATVRLDMYLADSLGDSVMQQRAAEDYKNAVIARTALIAQLKNVANGATGVDMNNQQVNAVADAISAYKSNNINMTGASQHYLVGNTLQISLGCIPNAAGSPVQSVSDIPIPMPAGIANVQSSQTVDGQYAAFVDIPYASKGPAGTADFAFAASSDTIRLVDPLAFSLTAPNLNATLLIPSVVKIDATEQFIDKDEQGRSLDRQVHIAAAAECSSVFQQQQHPGALSFSFPNGVPPEITSPLSSMYQDRTHVLNWSPVDELAMAPATGDYPEKALSPLPPNGYQFSYWTGVHPRECQPLSLAIYDWLRISGPAVNSQALINWFNNTNFASTTNSVIYTYEFTPLTVGTVQSTQITSSTQTCSDILSRRVSSKQWVAIAGGALKSQNGYYYDLIIKDNVYNLGTINGGIHGGQPLANQIPPTYSSGGGTNGGAANPGLSIDQAPPSGGEYPYPAGSGVRPTYRTAGQAVDVRFRASGYPWTSEPCGPAPWPLVPQPY